MKIPRLRRTSVEWVDLYTRQTLRAMLWLLILVLLFVARPVAAENPAAMVALVVIAVAMIGFGTWAQEAFCDAWLAHETTPVRPLLALLVAVAFAAGIAATLPGDPRSAALAMIWVGLVWPICSLRDHRLLVLFVVLACAAVFVTTGELRTTATSVGVAAFLVFTVQVSLWLLEVVRRLDDARETEAALAVAEERLRFSRDVHDVLGRHLSTIAVRAELAAALARRDDPGAEAMMMEVRTTAHDALREARELARGYRASNLDQELDGARSLLAAAGIETVIDVEGLPQRWHEPAAWVVREAVTNVLRHSTASSVEVTWHDGVLSIANDGATQQVEEATQGVGLLGLTERLAPLGAIVSTTLRDRRWTVAVTMPAETRELEEATR